MQRSLEQMVNKLQSKRKGIDYRITNELIDRIIAELERRPNGNTIIETIPQNEQVYATIRANDPNVIYF